MTNNIQVKRAISPVVVSDNTAAVSQIIDRKGYQSCTLVIATGTLADADATFAVLVEDGDAANLSDNAAVADAELISQTVDVAPETAAAFAFGDDDEVRKIGYIGSKRYVRLTITPATNSGSAPIAAVAILGNPDLAPVVQASS
jgi:hypothetical protein